MNNDDNAVSAVQTPLAFIPSYPTVSALLMAPKVAAIVRLKKEEREEKRCKAAERNEQAELKKLVKAEKALEAARLRYAAAYEEQLDARLARLGRR